MADNSGFNYTYSAREQEEIKKIREKYAPPQAQEDKMAQLRRLDGQVYKKAQKVSLIIGIIGTLAMGTGMSLVMTDIGGLLGATTSMIIGIATGVIGIALASLAYPLYNHIVRTERKKIAPEILRLTDELLK